MIAVSLGLRCQVKPLVVLIKCQHKLKFVLGEISWKKFSRYVNSRAILFKFTKFLPFIQIYLVNNQIII